MSPNIPLSGDSRTHLKIVIFIISLNHWLLSLTLLPSLLSLYFQSPSTWKIAFFIWKLPSCFCAVFKKCLPSVIFMNPFGDGSYLCILVSLIGLQQLSKQAVSLLGTTGTHFTIPISLPRYNLASTCSCPTQFHFLGYRFLNDSLICLQHIYKVFACLWLSWDSTFMNKIRYQLLDECLGPCLALRWRFLTKYLAASRCMLLSAVCRSRVPLRRSKYSSVRRFKYVTLWLLSKSLVSITDYFWYHYYAIIISNSFRLRNSGEIL